ncbi:1,2-dihydroxy-3-keto-5-methylthiopentene dioxygenase [Borealophlyctis nickersoniae]|nr:1,2-dihydroxy-3-keto-5-methylthiopentene dioxygenase [Borealophlyctis nickersoniae]
MVQAWVYADSAEDCREPHQHTPNQPVPLSHLEALGITFLKLEVTSPVSTVRLEQLCKNRQYKYRDEITISKEKLPNYEDLIKAFFTEHMHDDEEIRYILEGTGYFDVRDKKERWIRFAAETSDLIILPPGIYHRFTLDSRNYLKAIRVFQTNAVWKAHNRSDETDATSTRKAYLGKYGQSKPSSCPCCMPLSLPPISVDPTFTVDPPAPAVTEPTPTSIPIPVISTHFPGLDTKKSSETLTDTKPTPIQKFKKSMSKRVKTTQVSTDGEGVPHAGPGGPANAGRAIKFVPFLSVLRAGKNIWQRAKLAQRRSRTTRATSE